MGERSTAIMEEALDLFTLPNLYADPQNVLMVLWFKGEAICDPPPPMQTGLSTILDKWLSARAPGRSLEMQRMQALVVGLAYNL
jgi:hypothetical protein